MGYLEPYKSPMTYFQGYTQDVTDGDFVTALYATGLYGRDYYAPFDPLSLNPTLWLDGNDESTITKSGSDEISQWDDKSGNGNNATQGTVIQQPNFTTSAIGSNSAPLFDGSNDKMETSLGWTFQFHLFVVARPQSVTGVRTLVSSYDGVGGLGFDGQYVLDVTNGNVRFQAANMSIIFGVPSFGMNINTDYLFEVTSTAAKSVQVLVNQEQIGATRTHGATAETAPINIGEDQPPSGSAHFKGPIGDIFLFPSVLSAGNRAKMISYFTAKYPGIGL